MGTYALAAALIIATPGADVLLTLATALANGRRAGLAAVGGLSTGYLFHSLVVAAGLAVVLARSPRVLAAMELAGAAYLTGAGVTQLRRRHDPPPPVEALREPYRRGLVTSVSNPKSALFFLAFLPQFLPVGGHRNLTAFGLGLVFAALTVAIYGSYALVAGHLRGHLAGQRTHTVLRTICGLVFIGLALGSLRAGLRH